MLFSVPDHSSVQMAVSYLALSPKRAVAYAGAAFIAFSFVWYLFWLLPVHAWFRQPIELSGVCPNCGSRDFRSSHTTSPIDRIRKKLGLHPYRCRGCTKRFISRSTGDGQAGLSRLPEIS
jgi:hypothetical protein